MKRALGLLLIFSIPACRHQPTRLSESRERPFAAVVAKSRRPIEISEQTVVLDARSAFDFGLNRVQKAVNFSWDRLAERRDTGEFARDLHRAGERLALVGVTRDTPVVVVGNALKGAGEDGRLAWDLVRLGVRDVQLTSHESLRRLWTQRPGEDLKNAPAWEPSLNSDLEIDDAGFKSLAGSLDELRARRIWLIDVRSAREYLEGQSIPGSLNIAWTEFFGTDGRPSPKIVRHLAGVDVRPADRVILISHRGVRAGAAAYALMALGFANIQTYRR